VPLKFADLFTPLVDKHMKKLSLEHAGMHKMKGQKSTESWDIAVKKR